MARIIPIAPELLLAARSGLEPPPSQSTWKPRHVQEPLAPWFELTPQSPAVDDRINDSDAGVTATLETFGGVTGLLPKELKARADEGAVVLGGSPVKRGTPGDSDPREMRRRFRSQSTVRLRVAASGLANGRQCLVLFSLWGERNPGVQVFLGAMAIDEVVLGDGSERLAILADIGSEGSLLLDLWLRLSGSDHHTHLAVRGVQGFLL